MFNQDLICLVLFHIKVNSCFLTVVITSELMCLITAACVCLCSLHPISGTGHIISYADFFFHSSAFWQSFPKLPSLPQLHKLKLQVSKPQSRKEKKTVFWQRAAASHDFTFIFYLCFGLFSQSFSSHSWHVIYRNGENEGGENIIIARKCFRT